MILPYYVRLVCLCCATFFAVHAMAWLAVHGVAVRVMERFVDRIPPSTASRWLFLLGIFPPGLALFAVFGVCIPNYLWLEPDMAREAVGGACLGAAWLGAILGLAAAAKAIGAWARTHRYLKRCERDGTSTRLEPGDVEALVVNQDATILGVAGVLRPRLVVSKPVLQALTAGQIEVVLRHEGAHQATSDNFKRLLLLLAPNVLPFVSSRTLWSLWSQSAEWAADDAAVGGDRQRALALASALVQVAKLGIQPKGLQLQSALLEDDQNLAVRVERLLKGPVRLPTPKPRFAASAAGCAAVLLLFLVSPQCQVAVHQMFEHLVH